MAFDQSTRNRLQKFVSNARAILGEEFTRQLQATYGLDPKQGTVAAIDSLTHLDNRQRQTAHLLRETLSHYLATTPGKGEKDRTKQVLDRIVREQAFTVLNRLAALRMAEARGFLLESIAKAHSSKGFQLYRQLSGTAHGETGDAYRNYLFSLFDEFSLDLAVLFDRHSAQGRLFPRETALLELLAEINHHEIEHLWAEDETIGWIYQYFNSQEERKKMRDPKQGGSQAPRNSRELAVRNQFFTPRYVVEFLTDNTLGRIWYEMTQGNTALVDSCRYLVRRPTEIFLKSGETAPVSETSDGEALSQEELLKQPVYIPYRPLKDPRSIGMLDPACGSMHFGLYAFDLFERIYLEAWQLEQQLGPDAFTREAGQQALQSTYESFEAFKQQIPKLIIEHNIHGVDIDPRAVQIAGLSLWQRAQRAWHQQGIKPQQRPTIVKSNIVYAEPMPGEKALLQEFTSKLNPPVLGQLLEVIFDKMQLAGEAGTLLKIEDEIQTAIHEAREQWLKQSGSNSVGDMFQAELDAATPQAKLGFDLRGIDDETFWDDAEQRILQALSDYADQAESNADQKRLFAEDAAKGFAFIDLCRKRFDVVLMNPPFGDSSSVVNSYLKKVYDSGRPDLYMCFIFRSEELLAEKGKHGSITSRTFLTLQFFKGLREKLLSKDLSMQLLLDTGSGVLDGATVETCCLVAEHNRSNSLINIFDLAEYENKDDRLISCIEGCQESGSSIYLVSPELLRNTPGALIAYKIPSEILTLFNANFPIDPKYAMQQSVSSKVVANVRQGLIPGDQFRFTRSPYETPNFSQNWKWCAKGGEYSNYVSKEDIKINWHEDGAEIKAFAKHNYGGESRTIKNTSCFFKPGISFPRVSSVGLNARVLSGSYTFSDTGMAVIPVNIENAFALLVFLNSDLANYLAQLLHPGRKFEIAHVASLPVNKSLMDNDDLKVIGEKLVKLSYLISTIDPEQYPYKGSFWMHFYSKENIFGCSFRNINDVEKLFVSLIQESNNVVNRVLEISSSTAQEIYDSAKPLHLARKKLFDRLRGYYQNKEGGKLFVDINLTIGDYLKYRFIGDSAISADGYGKVIDTINSNGEFVDLVSEIDLDRDTNNGVVGGDSIFSMDGLDASAFLSSVSKKIENIEALQDFSIECERYLVNPRLFFEHHLKMTSFGGRQAPIYWPLQTPSGYYTLWVYYHLLGEQTLYTCVNDFVEPKLQQVEQDLHGLRSKSARSSQEEKELEKLSDLASELRDFRDELLRLAKFWKPNLNDGVQISAAPLWKLFQHKAWQKKLKETWESLEKGDYDWAHLACTIWPERVLRKCHQDRSLAIAHDVEDHFWQEVEVPVKRGKKLTGETKLEWQPKDLSEPELTALVKQLAAELK